MNVVVFIYLAVYLHFKAKPRYLKFRETLLYPPPLYIVFSKKHADDGLPTPLVFFYTINTKKCDEKMKRQTTNIQIKINILA